MNLNKIWEILLDCIFPRKSINQIVGWHNSNILNTKTAKDVSQNYNKDEFYNSKVIVATDYKLIKTAIYNFKYLHHQYLGETLGQLLSQKVAKSINSGELELADLITFVPADPKRLKIRGFNSPQVLAHNLAKELKLESVGIFEKIKHTKAQAGLSKSQRLENLDGVFKLNLDTQTQTKLAKAKSIYLVDDVIASGQTVSKLNKILFEYYPKLMIINIALARNEEI